MGITTDRNDPGLRETDATGMQKSYLVLSEEERARGFIRPVRRTYTHTGQRPTHPLRDLTDDEHTRLDQYGYVAFEAYPESDSSITGRFWTQAQLSGGCGTATTMGQALAETYARQPDFYGATWCCGCRTHLPVAEFVWDDGSPVGS